MPTVVPRTFTEALERSVARTPGDPLVTFYDERTGERVELSYVTYANWVAKTACLLQDELGLARGGLVAVDLPTHWLAPVWLGAAWSLGLAVGDATVTDRADLVVCGPDGPATYAGRSTDVVACSLLPMGARFRTPLPPGVIDFGEVVWSQPDRLLVIDPAHPQDLAWTDAAGHLDQSAVLSLPAPAARSLTTVPPCSRAGLPWLVGPLLSGAGTVWVAGAGPERLAAIGESEHARPGGS
jgi:uncharacterized protein (TIGR03089 family)